MLKIQSAAVRPFVIAAGIVALVLFVLVLNARNRSATDPTQLVRSDAATDLIAAASPALVRESTVAQAATGTPTPRIAVDVIGAIAQPGMYWLDPAVRVGDVIDAAGGFTPDADRDAVNLAAMIADGQQIRVPRVGERSAASQPGADDANTGGASDSGDLIDLNRADADALDSLPGIGPATAEAILAYREANGPFKRSEDLQNVKGIGPAVYAKIEDAITVGP